MAASASAEEESPDFIGHGARCKPGQGDLTESATETYRPFGGKGEIVR